MAPTGAVTATLHISNGDAGFAQILEWLNTHAPEARLIAGVEGTRSYGIGLTRALSAAGIAVVEVNPAGQARRGRGKTDALDAHNAAMAVLTMDATKMPTPRADGDREALRILLVTRTEMVTLRTAQTNRLHAMLLAGDDRDRELARGKFTDSRLVAVTRRRLTPKATREQRIRHAEIRRPATALRLLHDDLRAHRADLLEIVDDLTPGLLKRPGLGPVSAAQALVSFSHTSVESATRQHSRVWPAPVQSRPAAVRYRLSRGGDRALNRAVYTIAITRMRCCKLTREYVKRRRAEGKSTAEICRCLKRYITRELFRALTAAELARPGTASPVEARPFSSGPPRRCGESPGCIRYLGTGLPLPWASMAAPECQVSAMTWVPQACTLPTEDQPLRVAEFDELFAVAVRPADRLAPSTLCVHLPPGEDTVLVAQDLVARETDCCSFFTFELRVHATGTELEARVPESQTAVLDAIEQRAEAARTTGDGAWARDCGPGS